MASTKLYADETPLPVLDPAGGVEPRPASYGAMPAMTALGGRTRPPWPMCTPLGAAPCMPASIWRAPGGWLPGLQDGGEQAARW